MLSVSRNGDFHSLSFFLIPLLFDFLSSFFNMLLHLSLADKHFFFWHLHLPASYPSKSDLESPCSVALP